MTIGLAEIQFDLSAFTDLDGDWYRAYDELSNDLEYATVQAGEAGIEEMQRNHPYTDRTYQLSGGMHITDGERTRMRCTKYIDFLAPYARYVNDGTAKSRPYPFLPQGVEAAQKRLDECMQQSLDHFCRVLAG